MKLFSKVWNYIFERSFNVFDLVFFSFIWQYNLHINDWQFWAIIIGSQIVSQGAQVYNERLKNRG